MKKTQTLSLNSIKQLIDLNGDLTNFDLTFHVKSTDNSDFQAVVVDQNTLDNNPNIEYKNAAGTISGNIIADKNVYQNYLLLLKSENPCDCEVTIDVKPIPPNPNLEQKKENTITPPPEKPFNWKSFLTILGIILAIGFAYYYFFMRNKSEDLEPIKTIIASPKLDIKPLEIITEPIKIEPIVIPEIKQVESTPTIESIPSIPISTPPLVSKRVNEDLLSKLKNLPTISKKN
jgi:hypothetical protein